MKQYRYPAQIAVEAPADVSIDRVLAVLEIGGQEFDPSTLAFTLHWERQPDGRWYAEFTVDLLGQSAVDFPYRGIDIERPTGIKITGWLER